MTFRFWRGALLLLVAGFAGRAGAQVAEAGDAAERLGNARAAVVALEERHGELESANRELTEKLGALQKSNKELGDKLTRQNQALAANQAAARKFSASLARRLYRNASRHVNGMAAVAIPYVGAGVTAAMTALDIRESCEALRELNEMQRVMQLEPENEAPVCAMQVGSREQIINQVLANWRSAYAVAAAWTNQYEIWLAPEPVPVEPARAIELWSAVFGTLPNPSARAAAGSATPRGPLPPLAPMLPQLPTLPAYPAR